MQELYPITALRIYELWLTHSAPRTTPIGGVLKYLVQKSRLPAIQVTEELSLEQASTEKGLNGTLSSGPLLALVHLSRSVDSLADVKPAKQSISLKI